MNLVYPAGIQVNTASLSVLPGGHLLRDVALSGKDDGDMRRYLQARGQATHPITGRQLEPLDIAPLPPGSIVCGLSHAPHRVGKNLHGPNRWCINYAYKCAEASSGLVWPPGALPPVWALKARDGDLPEPLARLFRTLRCMSILVANAIGTNNFLVSAWHGCREWLRPQSDWWKSLV